MSEPIDQDHPTVQAIRQAVLNHGWVIMPRDIVELVEQVFQALADHNPQLTGSAPPSLTDRSRKAERVVREMLPECVHTPEGDRPEIPDDLIEEIAAILTDHRSENR